MPRSLLRMILFFSFPFYLPLSANTPQKEIDSNIFQEKKINHSKLQHAITLYGEAKYPADFTHFNYTNPNAPKGGELKQAAIGSFDSLNPYINKGTAAAAISLIYDTLLTRSQDEPLTKYGRIAEKIELDPNNNWVSFYINPKARFHDKKPITAYDVKFSFDILRDKVSTFYKGFYKDIKAVKIISPKQVVFQFKHNKNKELPLILGQLPIFPAHYWENRDFSSSGMEAPLGSGPYKIASIIPGRSITYERVKDYWGEELPVNKGRFNFDRLTYEYYRDNTVALQALVAGEYDFKLVDDPRVWHNQVKDSGLQKQGLIRRLINNKNPQTLTLTYNTRRPFLKEKNVREALGYAFDFNWINKHQFHSMYSRANSYFAGTELAAEGIPDSEELKLLRPWAASIPQKLFTTPYTVPGSEAPYLSTREKKKKSLDLLQKSGWQVVNNKLQKDGKLLELEALVMLPEHEKTLFFFKKSLAELGIKLTIRRVDIAQYIERIRNKDFDMVMHTFPHTPSPGTEQASFWGSAAVDQYGSHNLTGSNLPVLDMLTAQLGHVTTFKALQSNVKAIDRVLLWQQYSLPLWYLPVWPVIHKETIHSPQFPAPFVLDILSWWYQKP